MAKYRFKTEEEFKKEGRWLEELGIPTGWNPSKKMNQFLGQPIADQFDTMCASGSKIHGYSGSWTINPSDYVKITDDLLPYPAPISSEKPVSFDINRLSREIDDLVKKQLKKLDDTANKDQKALSEFATATNKLFQETVQKVYSEIAESLRAEVMSEILSGRETIVINTDTQISIRVLDHPKMKDVMTSLLLTRKALLVGPAGTGKTYMVSEIADRFNIPFYKYSCSRDSSVHDLLGYKQPASETYLETTFLNAYENGGVFLVDEYDAMSGDMALFFNGVADGSKFISIPHRDTKPIATKHKDFYLVMCGNTWGKGSLEYSGRDFQDLALMDRFRFSKHFIDYHFELEKSWMGNEYPFVKKVRSELENMGSYLSTRNIEDMKILRDSGLGYTYIIPLLCQDFEPVERESLLRRINNGQA